jgi:protein phosphatase
MGGHAGGDKASRLAVETISKSIRDIADDPLVPVERNLAESVEAAHNAIMDYADNHPDMKGMGTTLIMLLIKENQYWWVNVGDSRLYIMRGKEVTQISKDHSVVQGMVDAGIITAEQALDHLIETAFPELWVLSHTNLISPVLTSCFKMMYFYCVQMACTSI